jgi:phospholipid/cholesterol/gamma-HCH transport system substrate-binding protein
MAAANKVKWSQLKVGVMALLALLILAFLIILMTGTNPLFQKYAEVYTYLDDSSAMTAGATPVRLNGILIGTVKKIELSGSAQPGRKVKLTLDINQEDLSKIPVDSTAKLAQQNLLGSRFVNIDKGQSQQTIQPGGEIASAETPEIEDLFQQGSTTLAALKLTVDKVNAIIGSVESGQGNLGKLLYDDKLYKQVLATVDELHKLSVTLNSPDSNLGRLLHEDTLYQHVDGTVTRINTLLDGLNNGEGTFGKLLKDSAVHDELLGDLTDIRTLLAGLNNGEGTAGKLLKSTELHDQLLTSLGKIDDVLDKINNGQGTVSQLLNNPALYEDLDITTREIQGMVKDFRANPKKFLTIQLKLW